MTERKSITTEVMHTNPRRLVPGQSRYQHTFGGPIGDIAPKLANEPIHVLYTLDLQDPLLHFLGIDSPVLPLIFPLTVDGAEISYLCTPDGGVKLLGKKLGPRAKDWPAPNYPAAFPKTPVLVRALGYEEYRTAVFRYQMRYIGWLREDDQKLLKALGDPFTQLGGIQEMPMGEPFSRECPNPGCGGRLWDLASIQGEPVPGVSLWDGYDCLLVYFICTDCRAIHAYPMID